MRCKPNDLVVVVRAAADRSEALGSIRTVLHALTDRDGVCVWQFDRPIEIPSSGLRISFGEDECLQPIRPPAIPACITTTAPELAHAEA